LLELVALANTKLDYSLFNDNLTVERVSPGVLQKSPHLTSVRDAITSADPNAELWEEINTNMETLRNLSQRQTSVPREVELRVREEVIRKPILEIESEAVKMEADCDDLLTGLKRIADDDAE
jgi:hypothetical protein